MLMYMLLQGIEIGSRNNDELQEHTITEQLVQVLSKCRTEELVQRAMERTVETQKRNLESERNQHCRLQKQFQTLLNEKVESQKLMHKTELCFQKISPVIENAER